VTTSEEECVEAIEEAAERLGESPTKAQYEELGLTPSASTILRVVGGWNEAKTRAGLEVTPGRGSRVAPQPDHVDLPEETDWSALSQDQRWHYRNPDWNTERTLERRRRTRRWLAGEKRRRGGVETAKRSTLPVSTFTTSIRRGKPWRSTRWFCTDTPGHGYKTNWLRVSSSVQTATGSDTTNP
jgi:hypothetical protein